MPGGNAVPLKGRLVGPDGTGNRFAGMKTVVSGLDSACTTCSATP